MNHIPRKRFGQNFLKDSSIISHIVDVIGISEHDHLVEIGPGEGAITLPILKMARKLDVVEIDRDLVAALRLRFSSNPKFCIHEGDALNFRLETLDTQTKLRVIGNLPYNISTPLLFHLFQQLEQIEDMHFMLQKEVVDRMCALPGESNYGRLSVMTAYYCAAESLFDVPPESFFPAPKVMSAVVRLSPHRCPPIPVKAKTLEKVVSTAFSQRRKTLRNSLKSLFDASTLETMEIDPQARAETLSLNAFGRLAACLERLPEKPSE